MAKGRIAASSRSGGAAGFRTIAPIVPPASSASSAAGGWPVASKIPARNALKMHDKERGWQYQRQRQRRKHRQRQHRAIAMWMAYQPRRPCCRRTRQPEEITPEDEKKEGEAAGRYRKPMPPIPRAEISGPAPWMTCPPNTAPKSPRVAPEAAPNASFRATCERRPRRRSA